MILFSAASRCGKKKSLFLAADLEPLLDRAEVDWPLIEEVARAVDEYAAHWLVGNVVDERAFFLFAARAMWAVGEKEQAARVLLLGSGLVRPADWDSTGPMCMWILDLGQLLREEHRQLELLIVSTINTTLEMMASFWDRTGGSGALGLRCVSVLNGKRQAATKHKLPQSAVFPEVSRHCRKKLEQLSRRRAWRAVPRVINLYL
ncbi:MAG: hypothetical protein ACUVWX_09920 [Kiritimatiellia bacterium]